MSHARLKLTHPLWTKEQFKIHGSSNGLLMIHFIWNVLYAYGTHLLEKSRINRSKEDNKTAWPDWVSCPLQRPFRLTWNEDVDTNNTKLLSSFYSSCSYVLVLDWRHPYIPYRFLSVKTKRFYLFLICGNVCSIIGIFQVDLPSNICSNIKICFCAELKFSIVLFLLHYFNNQYSFFWGVPKQIINNNTLR